ncbi:probable histone-lysine N-methyltransferase CG1716 [Hermetia illucens]|nr:probable histone-lysine N-methyltransferase CG1716 [Hermetia illucens]
MKLIEQRVDSPIDSESSISDKVPTVAKMENTKRRSKEGSKPPGRSKESESKESELEQKTTSLKRTSLIATSESERSDKSREFSEKNPKKRKLSSIVPGASEVGQSERTQVEKLGLSAISKDSKVGVTEKSKVKKLELEKRTEKLCMLEDIDIFAGKEVDSTASDKIRKSKESRRSTLKKENKASAKRYSNSLDNVTVTSTLGTKSLNEGSKQEQSNILDQRLIKGGSKDNDVNSCEPTGATKADKLEIEAKTRVLKADSNDKPLSPMTCQNSKKDASHAASLKSVDVSKSETNASESETMTPETANSLLMEPNVVMTTKGNGGSAENCKNIENSNEDVFQVEQMVDKKSLPEYERSHLDSSDENKVTHDSNSKAADRSGAATPPSSSNQPQHEVCDDGRSVVTLPENEKNSLDRPEMMKITPAISQTTVKSSAENSSSVTQEVMTKSQNSAEPRTTSNRPLSIRGRKKFNDADRQIEASLDDSYVEAKSKSKSSIKGNVTTTKIQSRHSIDVDLQKIDEKLAKIQASMMKGHKRNEQPRKGRTKRSLSKSLSTSDGVSDAYSSDSNDSKQSIRNNTENAAKSEKGSVSHQKEDPLSQSLNNSLPPASNLSSVLNGLSKVVMNDLLEWTCNNKQTVLQIKDTIDQNQRETSTLKNDVERSESIQDSAESEAVKADVAKVNNNDSLCEVEQGKQSTQSPDESKESQNKDVKKDTITTPSKDPAVIQTSKEMLAELMNSTLDIDLDNFADNSESAEKSELITKSKLSQEIKRLIKSSDGEFSVKSSDSEQTDQNSQDSSANIRRSHRIKTQIKSTVGRGLVRDKSDRNQNSASALDLEAQNARFLKDMEERLSQFQMIKENEYKCERIISKEAKRMTCDCFLTKEEEERGELGCGEDCLNRLLMIECSSKCTVGERCTNRRFQKYQHARCKVFRTEKKGFGIMADGEIPAGEFIMEYVGEVLNGKQFEKRAAIYSQDKNKHYYFMALRGDSIIDATMKGSISRFINHSCDPNAETQKWTVNGELRIGFFSKRKIYAGEEITFDYQFQRYGKEAQKCFCESVNCRGWIGEEPDSEDEEEEVSSSESEDEVEAKSPEDAEAEKDKRLELKVAEKEKVTPTVAIQEEGDNAEILKEITAIEKSPGEILEGKAEKVIPIETPTDKDKSARKALKAAEKFAKIAAKMKARKERERIKQQNRMVMEDPDLEAEIVSLESSGLINQAHTLKLSRCMVRAKSVLSKLRLLSVLRKGEMACRRLFLDYHGLRLLHGWMSENETADIEQDLEFRQKTLKTLELLPIPNKTMLKESKVFDVVQSWSTEMEQQISSSETPLDSSDRQSPPLKKQKIDDGNYQEIRMEIKDIADKLTTTWEVLPEVFRIPKRERIEQMKEHEREADRSYKALNLGDEDQYNKQLRSQERFGAKKSYKWARDKYEKRKELTKDTEKLTSAEANLTKLQRRQLFAAKVAKDEAEKRLAEERREFEFKCKFYGLDPRYMTPNIMPFCVNPSTGQWYSKEKNKIPTPPSHAHIKVPPKPQSTDPKDYKMPEVDLPPMWKFAMDPRGRLYYYHIKIRIPQWEPPIKILPLTRDPSTESTALEEGSTNVMPSTSTSKVDDPQPGTSKQSLPTSDTSSGSDDTDSDISCSEIIGLKKGVPLKLGKDMIEQLKRSRKRKRFNRLVQERTISPRREEDRLYNQIETRRYRENKEKIRRRKEEIKRRKAQLKREAENDQSTSNKDANSQPSQPSSPKSSSGKVSVPIQDYLLSSDEDELEKSDYDNSLIEKIVHGDNIVDELDAIAKEKPLKRSLPFVKDHDLKKRMKMDEKKRAEGSKSDKSIKSRKTEAGSNKNTSRRAREKFRSDIAGIIVHHLTPYRRDSCHIGRITNNDDFKHLARKLTHFVLIKELKHCDSTGQTLVVTESVKNKSREFIKKYMAKYGEVYVRPANDPEFRDIPH